LSGKRVHTRWRASAPSETREPAPGRKDKNEPRQWRAPTAQLRTAKPTTSATVPPMPSSSDNRCTPPTRPSAMHDSSSTIHRIMNSTSLLKLVQVARCSRYSALSASAIGLPRGKWWRFYSELGFGREEQGGPLRH